MCAIALRLIVRAQATGVRRSLLGCLYTSLMCIRLNSIQLNVFLLRLIPTISPTLSNCILQPWMFFYSYKKVQASEIRILILCATALKNKFRSYSESCPHRTSSLLRTYFYMCSASLHTCLGLPSKRAESAFLPTLRGFVGLPVCYPCKGLQMGKRRL